MRPKKKNGLKAIAQAAGVSIVSVSNAINGRKGISQEKREKILEIAESLGYSVSAVIPSAYQPRPKFMLLNEDEKWYGIFGRAAEKYNVEILLNKDDNCDGVIIADRLETSELTALSAKYVVPLVGIMFSDFDVDINYVMDDGFHDAARAVKLLCDKDCRKIAVAANLEDGHFTAGQVTDRILGCCCQMQMIGDQIKDIDFSKVVAASDYRQFFNAKKLPDGIVCIGEKCERALLRNFKSREIRVPEDVRIVACGLSDEDFTVPAVVCRKNDIAERALEILLNKSDDQGNVSGVSLIQGHYVTYENNEII